MPFVNTDVLQNIDVARKYIDAKSDLQNVVTEMTKIIDDVDLSTHPNTITPAREYGSEITEENKLIRYNMYRARLIAKIEALDLLIVN